MKVFADLHIHSRYSRATSKALTIENLSKWAKVKGMNLLGTGDFTHPLWLDELKSSLKEDGSGILKDNQGMNFVLQAEVSNIYSQDGKLRKIHNVLLAPDFETVEQINDHFSKKGKLASDGRPIFGKYPSYEMVEDLKKISNDIHIIPAHIWTPWFSLFGDKSGFDKIEDCFRDQTKHIFALETGLSSDPAMNWRLSQLDKYTLISNSDLHSFWPWRIGREANVINIEKLSYNGLIEAIRDKKMECTIEVDPNYGKYHFDGHRNCNVCFSPEDSIKYKNICPACGKPLTIGVLHRIEELADRPVGFKPEGAIPFKTMLPLSEIISKLYGISGIATKRVWAIYNPLIEKFGSEMAVLLEAPKQDLEAVTTKELSKAIIDNRNGDITVAPGYDGEYGYAVFSEEDKNKATAEFKMPQKSLSDFEN